MPSKYKIIMEMASQTARDVTSNVERYTDFLVTAANNDGQADRTAQSPERRDRADEGGRSDEMGRTDELDPSLGRGSSPERPDLRINLPTVEEQQEIIAEAEADKTSAFTISQEDVDAVLTRGSGVYDGKYRIYEQYLKKESAENNITFLKNEYGVGGAYLWF